MMDQGRPGRDDHGAGTQALLPAESSESPAGAPTVADRPSTPVAEAPSGRIGRPRVARAAGTIVAMALIAFAALVIWNHYVTAPWTRDGRVRVQVANVAPQVSGQIVEIRIVDNQFVHKGDVLYKIDPFDFRVALATEKAVVKQRAADLQVKRLEAERRLQLTDLATTAEQQQIYTGSATQAEADFEIAQQQLSLSQINLERTEVRSPVNGFVTNLLLRVGDYATTGTTSVSIIDTDSFWIDGYFEETKLARLCVGDRAEAQLMGYGPPIIGRVTTVTRGISVSNATPSTQGLPSVDAVYTWVRLAQRVPVRIAITEVPPGVPLVSGLTATVTIRKASNASESRLARLVGNGRALLQDIVSPAQPGPDCIPPLSGGQGAVSRIPTPEAAPLPTPAEIVPELAPGVTTKPKMR